jgi:Gpi18-like mannosyltransferase
LCSKKFTILSKSSLITILVFGFIIRFLVAWFSIGANDAIIWEHFAEYIIKNGLGSAYDNSPLIIDGFLYNYEIKFNHPPLVVWMPVLLKLFSNLTDLSFYYLFKVPTILSDIGVCYLLWKIYKKRKNEIMGLQAAALYSICMPAILMSSYHGNTDSIYAFLCLLTAYFMQDKKQFFFAGLALSLAINIKLIPAMLVFPALLICKTKHEFLKLFMGLAIGTIPYFYGVLIFGEPFYENVISYKGFSVSSSGWGWTIILLILNMNELIELYSEMVKYVLLVAMVSLGFCSRYKYKLDSYSTFALSMMLFLILTSGFALQYLICFFPLLFAVSYKVATIYSLITGLYMYLIYLHYMIGFDPFYTAINSLLPAPGEAILIGFIVYGFLVYYFFKIQNNNYTQYDK